MNKTVLLLNVTVLVVNFFLALSTTDSQIGLLRTAVETSTGRAPRRLAGGTDTSVAFLKVVQSVGDPGSGGADTFNATNLRVLADAVRSYRRAIEDGVAQILRRTGDGRTLREAYDRLGRSARQELETQLSPHFDNRALVRRLATEIIRNS